MESGEIIYEKVYESPRPPPKISLRENWMKELGSEVAQQAEVNQPNPTTPQSNSQNRATCCDRNKRPVRVLRKSIHVSLVAARIPICLLNV